VYVSKENTSKQTAAMMNTEVAGTVHEFNIDKICTIIISSQKGKY
jgi:hypothetical protein